jgi:hypothetical protein
VPPPKALITPCTSQCVVALHELPRQGQQEEAHRSGAFNKRRADDQSALPENHPFGRCRVDASRRREPLGINKEEWRQEGVEMTGACPGKDVRGVRRLGAQEHLSASHLPSGRNVARFRLQPRWTEQQTHLKKRLRASQA